MPRPKKQISQPVPHSWDFEHWPLHVWPHSERRAKYIFKSNRSALIEAGALTRVGRDLVVLGAPYATWLVSQINRVKECPGAGAVAQA
jgi:hypothetical protein